MRDNYTGVFRVRGRFHRIGGVAPGPHDIVLPGGGVEWYALAVLAATAVPIIAVGLAANIASVVWWLIPAVAAAASTRPTVDGKRPHELAASYGLWAADWARERLDRAANPAVVAVRTRVWIPDGQDTP